jgi:hypothetical protein
MRERLQSLIGVFACAVAKRAELGRKLGEDPGIRQSRELML